MCTSWFTRPWPSWKSELLEPFFPGTETDTGTAGTSFQEPKPEPCFSAKTLLKCWETLSTEELLEPKTGTAQLRKANTWSNKMGLGGWQKSGFPKGWFWRMCPRNENRNEGTFGSSPGTKTGTKARLHVPPEQTPKRGHVRQNHPFTKPPFCLPVNGHNHHGNTNTCTD